MYAPGLFRAFFIGGYEFVAENRLDNFLKVVKSGIVKIRMVLYFNVQSVY